jgi:hypothetical protein
MRLFRAAKNIIQIKSFDNGKVGMRLNNAIDAGKMMLFFSAANIKTTQP